MTFTQQYYFPNRAPTLGGSNGKTTSTSAMATATATDELRSTTCSIRSLAVAAAAAAAASDASPSVNKYRFGVEWSPSPRAEAAAVVVPSPIPIFNLNNTQPTPSSTSTNTGGVHGFGLPAESTERHVDHPEIERAKSIKHNAPFFRMFPLLHEMVIELNMELLMLASHSHQVKHWVDVVGDKRKKQRTGQFKLAAVDLLSSTDTAMILKWNDHELAVMTTKVQNWIKYFRRRNKKNALLGWQKKMFSDLESSHGIKIL